MKVMVNDSVIELKEKIQIKTPAGIYDGYLLDLHSLQSAGVVAAEVSGGVLVIRGGVLEDIAIRGYLDVLVLKDVSVDYVEAVSSHFIVQNSRISRGQLSVKWGVELSSAHVVNMEISGEDVVSFRARDAVMEDVNVSISKLKQMILYGTRKRPIEIVGGSWNIDTIELMWLSGNQHWHSGFRLEVENYKHFIGESLKYITVKDVYIPRWLEMIIAYKNVEGEFSKVM